MNRPTFDSIEERATLLHERLHQLINEEIEVMGTLVAKPLPIVDAKTEEDVARSKAADTEEYRTLRDVQNSAWAACDDLAKLIQRIQTYRFSKEKTC